MAAAAARAGASKKPRATVSKPLFHNHILINSLTQQRQAAVSAVAYEEPLPRQRGARHAPARAGASLYADWLRNEPELVAEIAPKIVRATHAVNALFDSLFDLARIDSGHGAAAHRTGRSVPVAARPRTAIPASGRGQGPDLPDARDARHGADRPDPRASHDRQPAGQRDQAHGRGRYPAGLRGRPATACGWKCGIPASASRANTCATSSWSSTRWPTMPAPRTASASALRSWRGCRTPSATRSACARDSRRGSVFRVALHDADETPSPNKHLGRCRLTNIGAPRLPGLRVRRPPPAGAQSGPAKPAGLPSQVLRAAVEQDSSRFRFTGPRRQACSGETPRNAATCRTAGKPGSGRPTRSAGNLGAAGPKAIRWCARGAGPGSGSSRPADGTAATGAPSRCAR